MPLNDLQAFQNIEEEKTDESYFFMVGNKMVGN